MEFATRDEVRESRRPSISGREIVLDEWILNPQSGEGGMDLGRNRWIGDRHGVGEIGRDLVDRAPVCWHRLTQRPQQLRGELPELEQPHDLADDGEHASLWQDRYGMHRTAPPPPRRRRYALATQPRDGSRSARKARLCRQIVWAAR